MKKLCRSICRSCEPIPWLPWVLLLGLIALLFSEVFAQTRIGETQMPSGGGTSLRAIVAGISRLLPLDPSLEVAGTPPVLRVNPTLNAVRSKTVSLAYTGAPLTLPDTPLTTGAVLVFVGGLMQAATTDYTLTGTTLTPAAAAQPAWTAQGNVLVFYFF